MLKHRLIPNIIINNGKVVQSRNFIHTNVVGYAVTAVEFFNNWAVDEILILDVSRNDNSRTQFHKIVKEVSRRTFVPLTVGGWIRDINEIKQLLKEGADKISINTEAVKHPKFITEAANTFGSQCIVVSIDVKKNDKGQYEVFINRGKEPTGLNPKDWAQEVEKLGAGEILLTSIDHDGMREGYDISLLKQVCENVSIPVIAFGGVGKWQDLVDGINKGKADAVSAANILHFTQHSTYNAKKFMIEAGLNVRVPEFHKLPMMRLPKYEEHSVY